MGYSFRLTARVLLYAPSHRRDNTYHGLCYTSRGALAGTRKRKREGEGRRKTKKETHRKMREREREREREEREREREEYMQRSHAIHVIMFKVQFKPDPMLRIHRSVGPP